MPPPRFQGFTLIETLVSIFILAVAIMGTAGLLLNALRENQRAGFQATALQLSSELADMMRSNDAQMRLADDSNLFLGLDYSAASAPKEPKTLCYKAACDADEMARFALYEWQARVFTSLPGGRVRVCRDATPWDSAVGSAEWKCDGASNGPVVIKIGWRDKGRKPDGSAMAGDPNGFAPTLVIPARPYTP